MTKLNTPIKEEIMTFNTSTADDTCPRPKRASVMTLALQPWQLVFGVMTRRKAYVALSALDDHLLKDIGISRGEIEQFSLHATNLRRKYHRPPTPGQLRAAAGSRLLLLSTRR